MRLSRMALMGALVLALDQLSKRLWGAADFVLLPGLVNIHGTRNLGAAFGLFGGGAVPLSLITGLIALALLAYLVLKKPGGLFGLGLWLALFGAMGNLIDRLWLGYVVDFIELSFMRFPIFNVADIAVTIGCGLAALGVLTDKGAHHA